MTITTNSAGVATTGESTLTYGDYNPCEKSPPTIPMLQTFTEEISVTINQDGQMLEYEAENEVVRGRHRPGKAGFANRLHTTRQFLLCGH